MTDFMEEYEPNEIEDMRHKLWWLRGQLYILKIIEKGIVDDTTNLECVNCPSTLNILRNLFFFKEKLDVKENFVVEKIKRYINREKNKKKQEIKEEVF